jgi:hypothetical protein
MTDIWQRIGKGLAGPQEEHELRPVGFEQAVAVVGGQTVYSLTWDRDAAQFYWQGSDGWHEGLPMVVEEKLHGSS